MKNERRTNEKNERGALVEPAVSGDLPSARVLGELLGLLAHDLRNPLSALHSNLGFLDGSPSFGDPETAEAVQDGLISCESLRHMIDNVDLLSYELRGQLRAAAGSLTLWPLLEATFKRCEPVAKSHGVSLRVHARSEEQQQVSVQGTAELLHRLFANLLHNSIQHSPSHSEITVSLNVDAASVIVRIEDAGPAMTEERGQQAFTATGQSLTKTRGGGRYSRAFGLYSAALAARCCKARIATLHRPTGGGFEVSWNR